MSDHEEKIIKLMVQESGRLLSEIERLQAENDRLRELMKQMFKDCGLCDHECYRPLGNCGIITKMEELGIEGDE